MKKIAVILSGCGVFDGAEIHEATLAMLAIKQAGYNYQIFAPDVQQTDTVNHHTGQESQEKRNVLVESARIARGKALPLDQFNPEQYDALIIPGGFGAAKNLCNFASQGAAFTVIPQLEKVLKHMNRLGKPIGAICIAPVILAKVFPGSQVTVGTKGQASDIIEQIGSIHTETTHAQIVIDHQNKLVSTPCYMLDADITQIAQGTSKLVEAIIKLIP